MSATGSSVRAIDLSPSHGTGGWRRTRLALSSLAHFGVHEVVPAAVGLVIAIVLWWIVSEVHSFPWMPSPGEALRRVSDLMFDDPSFRKAFLTSLGQTAIGFFAATVIGALIGFAMVASRLAGYAFQPYLDLLLVTPPAAMAPVLVVMFGLSSKNIIIVAALFTVSIIAINCSLAMSEVDSHLIEVGRVMGIRSRAKLVRLILLPAVMPSFFVGLHLGVTRAMKGMIVGQVVIGVIGVGAYEARYAQAFDVAGLWAIALILIATSLVLAWLVRAADHVVNYWAYRS